MNTECFITVVLYCLAGWFLLLGAVGLLASFAPDPLPDSPGGRWQTFCVGVFLLGVGFLIVVLTKKL
jgi:hypothetical protein